MTLKSAKPRRFFYHYRKCEQRMSVHFRGACHGVNGVVCNVPCETKWNKRQPLLVMQGFANKVTITNGVATIE